MDENPIFQMDEMETKSILIAVPRHRVPHQQKRQYDCANSSCKFTIIACEPLIRVVGFEIKK